MNRHTMLKSYRLIVMFALLIGCSQKDQQSVAGLIIAKEKNDPR